MALKRFVIDANVASKWVLPEIHSETAWQVIDLSGSPYTEIGVAKNT